MVLCVYSYTLHIHVSVYIYMCMCISITPALDAASACAASAEAAVCRVSEKVIYSTVVVCVYSYTLLIHVSVYIYHTCTGCSLRMRSIGRGGGSAALCDNVVQVVGELCCV